MARRKATSSSGTYKGKSLAPGGGGRFAQLVDKLRAQGKSLASAKRIAAWVGRRKYGAKQMTAWSVAGKKRRR